MATTENKVGLKVKICHSAQPTAPAQDQENTEETPQKTEKVTEQKIKRKNWMSADFSLLCDEVNVNVSL